jgi:hypothetical protein
LKEKTLPRAVVHTCNLSTQEAEAGVSRVLGQLGLHNETLPQKSKAKKGKEKKGRGVEKVGSKTDFPWREMTDV